MTVRQMLATIDSHELAEWMAFYKLEPWGCYEDDRRFATLTAVVANANRNPKKRPYKIKDFMPHREGYEQSWQEQLEIARNITRQMRARHGNNRNA